MTRAVYEETMWRLLNLRARNVQEQLQLLEKLITLKNKTPWHFALGWQQMCSESQTPHSETQSFTNVNSFERREPEVRTIVKRFSLPQESMSMIDSSQ